MGIELPGTADVEAAIGHWRATDPRFESLFERYGDAPRSLRHYGLILWESGVPHTAVGAFAAAVSLMPTDPRLWGDLAGALNAAGQLREAAACLEESLLRDKMQADGWLRLGSIRSTLDDPDGAEMALKTALAIDPALIDARLSLGLIYFHKKRFHEAADHLAAVLNADTAHTAAVQACYGQTLGHLGDFAGAAKALRSALDCEPDNAVIRLKQAQVQFIADLIEGISVETATATCRASGITDQDFATISRQSFHLLAAFDQTEAAVRLGEARLIEAPEDPERLYLLGVLKGEEPARAPDAYVAAFFDQFAGEFDKQLVGVLGYKAFEQLVSLVDRHATVVGRVLDIGCGTGLSGPLLARPGRHLIGVDLSPGMLEKARARGCYDALIEGEVVSYLAGRVAEFDLIVGADVLIYLGDLMVLLEAAARALKSGGLFAFSLETSEKPLDLLPSGRFAHGLAHTLSQSEAAGFTTIETRETDIRYETRGFVAGALVVLRRN